jgi:hypothetical protein
MLEVARFRVHPSDVKQNAEKKEGAVTPKPVERLFPFALRARILIAGRDNLQRSKSRLHFILVTHDTSAQSVKSVLAEYAAYPVVQHFSSADLEKFFRIQGAKVLGFRKSGLAQSIYQELKSHRLNKPLSPPGKPPGPGPGRQPRR